MKLNNLFCNSTLKCIFLISFIVAITYPLANIYLIFPSFNKMIINNTENEAIRIAQHLSRDVFNSQGLKKVDEFEQDIKKSINELNLEKLKVFSESGEIVYSSNTIDIGKINNKPYFHEIVKNGGIYTKVVKKNTKSLEGRTLAKDVVETYVPITKNDKFIGAFEVYFDITGNMAEVGNLIVRSSFMVIILAIGFLAALIKSFMHTDRMIKERDKAVNDLRGYSDNLETIINERTEEIRKSKDEWERMLNTMDDIVTFQDEQMRIVRVNEAACIKLKATPEKLIGKHCYEVFRGSSTPCKGCPESSTMKDCMTHSGEITHPNLGLTFLVSASPIQDQNGKFKGIIHIAKDITEKKELERQLVQSQKMEAIGTLAGGIAHDFNNILTAIMGYTDLALVGVDKKSQIHHDISEIKKAGQRATDLVKQILAFSRQAGNELKPIRISSIIKEALKLLKASLPSSIKITQNIDYNTGIIKANPTQIHQVLMNLCSNAADSMLEKGGILQVNLVNTQINTDDEKILDIPAGEYLRLTVSDTGYGIPEKTLDRVFEPYFTTKEKGKGTGIGLAVVHGIIAGHGGTIIAESQVDQGTTFTIYLPIIESTPSHQTEKTEQAPSGTEHILFVDDEEAIVSIEKRALKKLGYTITTCTDPREALEFFRSQPKKYDLVITDMTMPNLTGDKLAKEILKIRPDTPIILCTGFSEKMTTEKATDIGIKLFLLKPLSNIVLGQGIRKVLDKK